MKWSTPELYVRINSPDDAVALAAHDEWERETKRYQRRYKKIERELPESLRKFHDEQCLHDADWCGLARTPSGQDFWMESEATTIIARQENTLIPEFQHTLAIVQYVVTAPPVMGKPVNSPVFSDIQPIWLYDEIDLVSPGVFSHSILVSNGLVVTIQFREFRYHIAPLLDSARNGAAEAARPAASRKSASA